VERLEYVRLVEAVDEALESPDRAAVRPFETTKIARVPSPFRAERAVDGRGRELGRLHREENARREHGVEEAGRVSHEAEAVAGDAGRRVRVVRDGLHVHSPLRACEKVAHLRRRQDRLLEELLHGALPLLEPPRGHPIPTETE